jgi:signal transduction histidine kinase
MQSTGAISQTLFRTEPESVSAVRYEEAHTKAHATFTIAADSRARYTLAFAMTTLAVSGRWALAPALGDHVPFALVYGAVVLSALFLGLGPSIAASVTGLICVRLIFAPNGFFRISSLRELAETLTYIGGCTLIVTVTEKMRRSRDGLKDANVELALRAEQLRALNEDLERRVIDRTEQLKLAEESARQLGTQVLRMQDEERRRIARDLHESVGQAAAVLAMNLGQLERSEHLTARDSAIVADTRQIARNVAEEVRTISYLLHPPLLDEMGLTLALKWYVRGFSQRSGIQTDLEISNEFGRLPGDFEIAIFRIVQEALTNVLRHSGSARADVRLTRMDSHVELEIADEGKGISADDRGGFASGAMLGVGLRGMRERAAQLGGRLDLHSSSDGTIVIASFPVAAVETAQIADAAVA